MTRHARESGLLGGDDARVLVIGAGPAGLAVAHNLKEMSIAAIQVDRFGVPGGAYQRMHDRLTLSSPVKFLELPGTRLRTAGRHASAREYASYLEGYAEGHGLVVQRREVVGVERTAGGYLVTFREERDPVAYAAVVVASGMCDYPAMPWFPGVDNDPTAAGNGPVIVHAQSWTGPESVTSKRVLIVGGRMRAVEIAEECVRAGLLPMMSAHRGVVRSYPRRALGLDLRSIAYPVLCRIPLWAVRRVCRDGWRFAAIDRGFRRFVSRRSITLRPDIARLDGHRVRFVDGSETEVDVIVCATGYRFEMPFLPAGIPRARQGYPLAVRGECAGWPGLFVLGTPCAVRADSQFIHGAVADAHGVAGRIAKRLSAASSNAPAFTKLYLQEKAPKRCLPILASIGGIPPFDRRQKDKR